MEIIIKIIQINLIWLLLFGLYHFFLRKETFFNTNRIYLLLALGLGIVLPFTFPLFKVFFEQNVAELPTYTVTLGELDIIAEEENEVSRSFHWLYYILIGYGIGVFACSIRFLKSLYEIVQLKQRGEVVQYSNYQLIKNKNLDAPFSFGKWLFLPENTNVSSEEEAQIINHELVHIHEKHTLDIILVEVLTILFWFNPLLKYFQNALREVHEYAADKVVLRSIPVKNYGQLLLQQAFPNVELQLVHTFHQSQLKKRIKMMTKKKSSKQATLKYLLVAPLLVAVFIVFGAFKNVSEQLPLSTNELKENAKLTNVENNQSADNQIVNSNQGDPIYTEVEKMPLLRECKNEDKEDRQCTQMKLLSYTYKNIKYPKEARENGIEGLVVLSFVVNKKGEMTQIKTLRDIADDGTPISYKDGKNITPEKTSSGLAAAAKVALLELAENKNLWLPGKQDGKAVNVKFNIPVRFRITSKENETAPSNENRN